MATRNQLEQAMIRLIECYYQDGEISIVPRTRKLSPSRIEARWDKLITMLNLKKEVRRMATLTPAYGRDYKSKAKAIEDFEANMDFVFNDFNSKWDGKICNKRNLLSQDYHSVQIRYNNLRSVCVHKF